MIHAFLGRMEICLQCRRCRTHRLRVVLCVRALLPPPPLRGETRFLFTLLAALRRGRPCEGFLNETAL